MARKPAAVKTDPAALVPGLRRKLRLTWVGLAAERVVRGFWPLWSVLMLGFVLLAFNIPAALQLEYFWALGVVMAALALVSVVYAVRRFRWPTMAQAQERLDATLPGRPLTALTDQPAIGLHDPASRAVWRAHVARMRDRLGAARAVAPDLTLSSRDPYALRYVAATGFAVALLFGAMPGVGQLTLTPGLPGSATPAGPFYEVWIEPPDYTGSPTLYLNDIEGQAVSAPDGSRLTIRLYGDLADMTMDQSVDPADAGTLGHEMSMRLRNDGTLTLGQGRHTRSWTITRVIDQPPQIALAGPVEGTIAGSMSVNYTATDDYGVTSGVARIELDLAAVDRRFGLVPDPEQREPIELDLPLPFTGSRTDITEGLVEDLSKHAWAGLPVRLTLQASDAAGQTSDNAGQQIVLPGRVFLDPLAAAIAENRRDLLWSVDNADRVSMVLRAVTFLPDEVFDNSSAYLITRAALRRLDAGIENGATLQPVVRDEVAELLWRAALKIEEGDLSDAEQRLRRAQERLSEALRQGASDDQIRELTQDLRQAMQDYMRSLAQNSQPRDQQQADNNAQQITPDQLQQMLDRIEELSRQGRNDEARQLLEELRRMMENMQVTQGQQGQGQGQQAMEDLQDTLRQQQGLADDAFRNLQEQFNQGATQGQSQQNEGRNGGQGRGQSHDGQGGNNLQQQGQGQGGGNVPSAQELANRQQALRDLLNQQQQNLPGGNTEEGRAAREALGRAGNAMDQAEDALRQNDLGQALDDQAEAMEAMREGLRNLGEAIARNQDPNQGRQGQQAGSANREDVDPLGRRTGTNGRVGSDARLLGDVEAERRTREIIDEIRRRSGDRSRPVPELDYLDRLLDRF